MTSGTKSSEFVSAMMASVASAGYGLTSESDIVQAAGLLAIGFSIGLFALGRGIAKGKGGTS